MLLVVVDPRVAPVEVAQELFSEKVIFLPHSYQSNAMPYDVSACINPRSCKLRMFTPPRLRAREEEIWICSFNANKKMESFAFTTWMNVLRRVPNSIFLLQSTDDFARSNILLQARFFGIDPVRIIFLNNASLFYNY